MHPYVELIRPINALMSSIAVYVGYALSSGQFLFNTEIALLMIAAACISGAGQTINDFFDAKMDSRVHPHRPIPAKRITQHHAFGYAVFLFAIGNLLSLMVGMIPFVISFFVTALLLLYAGFGASFKWFGNWMVGLSTGLLFIFGATLTGNYELPFLLAIPALFANVAREITKDLEDEQNGEFEKKSLASIVGSKNAQNGVLVVTLLAMGASIVPLIKNLLFSHYLIGVMISWVFFVLGIRLMMSKKYHESQGQFKKAMLFAMIGFTSGIMII